jgi:hypothetical protein
MTPSTVSQTSCSPHILSASRRTDIPAFYARWFIERIRAGYCLAPNPFHPRQAPRLSLAPQDIQVIVFWTRFARPLMPYLDELEQRGFRFYFQYTLLDYPRQIDTASPSLQARLQTFRQLADAIGPQHLVWRYDPILFSSQTPPDFHLEKYSRLAEEVRSYTEHSVISILTPYRKIQPRLRALADQGLSILHPFDIHAGWFSSLMRSIAGCAHANGMSIASCSSEIALADYGIQPGKCIDDEYLRRTFGLEVSSAKDPGQRKLCGCVASKDLGVYDTCLFGCQYCYAVSSFARSQANHARHDPHGSALLPLPSPAGEP